MTELSILRERSEIMNRSAASAHQSHQQDVSPVHEIVVGEPCVLGEAHQPGVFDNDEKQRF